MAREQLKMQTNIHDEFLLNWSKLLNFFTKISYKENGELLLKIVVTQSHHRNY